MDISIVLILVVVLLLFHCPIIEGLGIVYSVFLCSWADIILEEHSDYGVIAVTKTHVGQKILLTNDEVIHSIHGATDGIPNGYCYPESGVAWVLRQPNIGLETAKIALIGMGCGAILHYARAGQQWHCYEINPAIITLATNSLIFNFCASCPTRPIIHCADGFAATEQLEEQDIIIVDTFFGDRNVAYPEILGTIITQSAAKTMFILHLSGLPHKAVVSIAKLAADCGFSALIKDSPMVGRKIWVCSLHDFKYPFCMPAKWMVISANSDYIAKFSAVKGWKTV